MYKQKHKTKRNRSENKTNRSENKTNRSENKTNRSENKTKTKTQIDNKIKGYKISVILVLLVC